MDYKVGMFGGSFDPLHIGHIHDIIRAATQCEHLYIMISWCEGRESTTKELRYRWIYATTKHLSNVSVLLIEDTACSKADYDTDFYWQKGAHDIKAAIGKHIDVVYCGSDYKGSNRFESLYAPESKIVYFDRQEVPICSTTIRQWALDNWDYIPLVCRPFYTKKVLLVGSESTGKSTLVQNLALAYNTNFVEEVGRDICEQVGNSEAFMTHVDLETILLKHKVKELEAIQSSNRLLFIDTNCLITRFYANFLLVKEEEKTRCNDLADAISNISSYDLVFFIEPTNVFVQDGTRNELIKEDREVYSDAIKQILIAHQIVFDSLQGTYIENFNEAKKIIKERLKVDTSW